MLAELEAEALQLKNELEAEGVAILSIVMARYNHSVGLIMGQELWISAEPVNMTNFKQNIATASGVA